MKNIAAFSLARLPVAQNPRKSGKEVTPVDGSEKVVEEATPKEEEEKKEKEKKVTPIESEGGEKGSGAEKTDKLRVSFLDLFRFATPWEVFYYVISIIGAMCAGSGRPVHAYLFGQILNALNEDNVVARVSVWVEYMVYVGIGMIIAAYVEVNFSMLAGASMTRRVRTIYMKALLRQPISYYDAHRTGQLTTNVSTLCTDFQDGVSQKLTTTVHYSCTFIAGVIIAFTANAKLSAVALACFPMLIVAGRVLNTLYSKMARKSQVAYAAAGTVADQTISCIKTVAMLQSERSEIAKYDEQLVKAELLGRQKSFTAGLTQGSTYMILFAVFAIVLWYGAKLARDKEIRGGFVVTVMFSIMVGGMALGQAFAALATVVGARAAAHTLFGVIDTVPAIDSYSTEGKRLASVRGAITVKNVHFAYPTRPPVYNGLSMTIAPGSHVALVGASGSGKSTLVSLLQRFYDVTDGSIAFDDVDIRDLNLAWYRSQVGVVSQEPVLFSTSIRENIRGNHADATDEDIREAARLANALDFIESLPDGFNTLVGSRGASLSGGQKQRIAIARAIIAKPSVLLLDEATSALDNASERVVQAALEQVGSGRTTITVAHRLSTVRDVDCIYVFSNGAIVQQGTHDELMADRDGEYFKLVARQATSLDEQNGQTIHFAANTTTHHPSSLTSSAAVVAAANAANAAAATTTATTTNGTSDNNAAPKSSAADDDGDGDGDDAAAKKKEKPKANVSTWRVLSYASEYYGVLAVATMSALANGVISPSFGFIMAQMFDVFFQRHKRHQATIWAVVFFMLGFGRMLLETIVQTLFGVVGERITRRLRLKSFETLVRKDVGYFDLPEHSTGALTTQLATDASRVNGLVTRLYVFAQAFSLIVAALVISFYHSWQLGLLYLALMPLMGVGGRMQVRYTQQYAAASAVAYEGTGKIVTEALSSIRTVTSYNLQEHFLEQFQQSLAAPFLADKSKAHANGFGFSYSHGMSFLSFALAAWLGAYLIEHDHETFNDVITPIMTMIMAASTLGQVSSLMPNMPECIDATNKTFALIDSKSSIDPLSADGVPHNAKTDEDVAIEFRDAHFSYPSRPQAKILKGLDLRFQRNKTTALVGASGSGKSTIVALIDRWYDVEKGSVVIDGVDVRDLNVASLRSKIAVVSQEPVLFACSVRENIAYALPNATMEDVIAAAKTAFAHDFIMNLPQGYDTYVGERGVMVSGGQKQRIAIARAIIRNPEILLLDEATSALDTESEAIVTEALKAAARNRTTIVIAHRLSSIQDADIIVVMKSGRVVEEGTHESLLEQDGVYAKLYSLNKK